METVKQQTISGETYKLVRKKTRKPGKQYEYTVRLDDGRIAEDRRLYNKREAMQFFDEQIRLVRKGAGAERADNMGGVGFGLGFGPGPMDGGPVLPGFAGEHSDDDDDDGPYIPGL